MTPGFDPDKRDPNRPRARKTRLGKIAMPRFTPEYHAAKAEISFRRYLLPLLNLHPATDDHK